MFKHETEYRSQDTMDLVRELEVTVCGAGAVGSNLVCNLARQGFSKINVIDKDRVEEENVGTQAYGKSHIGKLKTNALANIVYHDTGVMLMQQHIELNTDNVHRLLKGRNVIVDCFDNAASRSFVQEWVRNNHSDCLHIGLHTDYAECLWDNIYKIPSDPPDDSPCDYPLARNIVMASAVIASECILRHAVDGTQNSFRMTLKDLNITRVD